MPARTRFISRQSELALLERGFGQACRGLPTVVLIQGEPGIGKTRLLSEFREKVARRGAFCGYGRAQQDVAPPYLLIADALMPLFEASERDRTKGERSLLEPSELRCHSSRRTFHFALAGHGQQKRNIEGP